MPIPQAPLRTPIQVPASDRDRDAASIYFGGGRQNPQSAADGGEFAFANSPPWAQWYAELVAYVNTLLAPGGSVTCGAETETINDWICNLRADDLALQAAVLAIDGRLNSIVCSAEDFDLETWICGLRTDDLALQAAVTDIYDRIDNVTVIACGTPFTQTLEDTLQDIVDNLFFDLGSGCAAVVDYIIDLYSLISGGPFMPIDNFGSGIVPTGQGIYADSGGGFEAGIALSPDVVFYEAGPTFTGAFLSQGSIGPAPGGGDGITNVSLVAFDGATYAPFQLVYDIASGVVRVY